MCTFSCIYVCVLYALITDEVVQGIKLWFIGRVVNAFNHYL